MHQWGHATWTAAVVQSVVCSKPQIRHTYRLLDSAVALIRCRTATTCGNFSSASHAFEKFKCGRVSVGRRIWYTIRALSFAAVATAVSIPLFLVMLLAIPFVFIFDRHRSQSSSVSQILMGVSFRRRFYATINAIWARLSSLLFYSIKVVRRMVTVRLHWVCFRSKDVKICHLLRNRVCMLPIIKATWYAIG